ncbi:MAG: hypothetical protein ACREMA_10425 [Longimicrobiales bacterium]
MARVFLLSPASSNGRRARMLCNEKSTMELAHALRTRKGAPLADVFAFLSGLYFRGKIAYARAFAAPPAGAAGIHIITPSRGLQDPDTRIRLPDLYEFAAVPIDLAEERYRVPLERSARLLAEQLTAAPDPVVDVVLLGSIASDKYVSILQEIFGARLLFPSEFVGRGDMSRGGLLLRCADDMQELHYIALDGAIRHGARPPRLEKRVTR